MAKILSVFVLMLFPNLGADVNGPGVKFCASVSPDGKYIFYTKNRDIYWVSTSILETLK